MEGITEHHVVIVEEKMGHHVHPFVVEDITERHVVLWKKTWDMGVLVEDIEHYVVVNSMPCYERHN